MANFLEKGSRILAQGNASLSLATLSNFASSFGVGIIGIIVVPINLYYLGIEAYGIIGIFNAIQSFVWLFDFGISTTLSQQLAYLGNSNEVRSEKRDLIRTASLLNLATGLMISVVFAALSPLLSRFWVTPVSLSTTTVTFAFLILGGGFFIQWQLSLYSQALVGLEKQVSLNISNLVFAVLRSFGALPILHFYSRTIEAFLIW